MAVALTVLAVAGHVAVFRHAGALWRDEASTVFLANLPTFGDVLNHLQFDSFPIVWTLLTRTWTAVAGPANDTALRLLGLLVGLGLLGAIWLTVRKFLQLPSPLLALVLVGLNPLIVLWGDSMRAWGLGSLAIVLVAGLLWRVIQAPTLGRVALAALAAILAVQTLYHNAFLLFALAAAAMIVAARRRRWRRAGLVAAIGLAAALSLAPYYLPITRAGQWNMLLGITQGFAHYWSEYGQLLGSGGSFMVTDWVALAVAAVVAAALAQSPRFSPHLSAQRRDLALFAGLALVISLAAYVVFLHVLHYRTNPWYFIVLTVLVAVALEVALGVFAAAPALRTARLVLAAALAAAALIFGWHELLTRQTNIDLIAAELQRQADKNDLILVSSWTSGVTFNRYYHGPTPWMTIPPLEDHQLHRYDLIKELMLRSDATRPNLEALARTLRSGHKVWLVGVLPVFRPGEVPAWPGPPPLPGTGWYAPPYEAFWPAQVGYFLQSHVDLRKARLQTFGEQVSAFENPVLEVVEGWHD